METRHDATTVAEAVKSICCRSSNPTYALTLLMDSRPLFNKVQEQAETVSASFSGDFTIKDEMERFAANLREYLTGLCDLKQRIREAANVGQIRIEDHHIQESIDELIRDHVQWAFINYHRRFQKPPNSA